MDGSHSVPAGSGGGSSSGDVPVQVAHLPAWVAFLQAYATVVGAVEAELMARRELPLSWYEVLARLATIREGSMRMQDLARGALLSKSGMTRLIDRMVPAGLVERRPCSSDRRVTYAAITEQGRRALADAAPVFFRSLDAHFVRHIADAGGFREALVRLIEGNGARPLEECHSTYAEDSVPSST